MKIFVVGATGFVGGAIAQYFVGHGHTVSGLVRSDEGAAQLRIRGIAPVAGDLEKTRQGVDAAASMADAVIFAPQVPPDTESASVAAILTVMERSDKTFIFLSGSGVFLQRTNGAWSQDSFAEDDEFVVEPLAAPRVEVEKLVRRASTRRVRGMVLRPPLIWGPGDHGHVAMIYRSVALTGAACYVGEGLASYSNVHIDDLVRLCGLVLDKGEPGALYHGVGGEVPNRWIAEAVARDMRCDTRRLTMEEAAKIWGEFGGLIMGASNRSRSPRSRSELGWTAQMTDMLSMIGEARLRAMATPDSQHR